MTNETSQPVTYDACFWFGSKPRDRMACLSSQRATGVFSPQQACCPPPSLARRARKKHPQASMGVVYSPGCDKRPKTNIPQSPNWGLITSPHLLTPRPPLFFFLLNTFCRQKSSVALSSSSRNIIHSRSLCLFSRLLFRNR